MTKLQWDKPGERRFETGTDKGVLYTSDAVVPWNGLISVNELLDGGEFDPLYFDGLKFLNWVESEEFAATIEAYTYPDEFSKCEGNAEVETGFYASRQDREPFGLSYRTLVGNEVVGLEHGYKLHLVYDATVMPSERDYTTMGGSPSAVTFSWSVTTTPKKKFTRKPLSHISIDSTKTDPSIIAALEEMLYGTATSDPYLPDQETVRVLLASSEIIDGGTPESSGSGTLDGGTAYGSASGEDVDGGTIS